MYENGHRESKYDSKRISKIIHYKSLTESEFLSKTHLEIRQEFRRIPNPPARDTYVAK